MSVYSLVFAGSTPIGNFFAGTTADKFGAYSSFILSGIITLVFIGVFTIIFRKRKDVNVET